MALTLTIRGAGGAEQIAGTLPEGDEAIRATLGAMSRIVHEARGTPAVRALAAALWNQALAAAERADGTTATTPVHYARKVYTMLRISQVFTPDPIGYERLQTPEAIIEQAAAGTFKGDCDDVAMLGAALLREKGLAPVFAVVGRTPKRDRGRLEHVFYGYLIDETAPPTRENVVPFDPQERTPPEQWGGDFARTWLVRA